MSTGISVNVVVLSYSTVFTRIETSKGLGSRKSEVESRKWSELYCFLQPCQRLQISPDNILLHKILSFKAAKVINDSNGKVNYRKSELGLPAQQFRVPVFYFRVPGARFSKVPLILPSPECFTCAVFNI